MEDIALLVGSDDLQVVLKLWIELALLVAREDVGAIVRLTSLVVGGSIESEQFALHLVVLTRHED